MYEIINVPGKLFFIRRKGRFYALQSTLISYYYNILHKKRKERDRQGRQNEKIEKKALNIPLDLSLSFFIIFFRKAVKLLNILWEVQQ
jgi:hypothetical protein